MGSWIYFRDIRFMAVICKTLPKIDYSVGIVSIAVYSFFIATVKTIDPLLFLPVLVQAVILKAELKDIFIKVFKVNLFIGITVLILFFEGKSELAVLVFARANLILWFTLSFNFDGFKLYQGLQNLKVANNFSLVLFFTVKYIEVLISSVSRIKEVLRIRGFQGKLNIKTFKTYGDIFAFLIYTSVNKMQMVHDVIHLRCKNDRLFPANRIKTGVNEILLLSSILGVIVVYYIK